MKCYWFKSVLCAGMVMSTTTEAQTLAKQFAGKLVTLKGEFMQPSTDPAIAQTKYIALYYGAGWCGPCHQFTPALVTFYNEMRPKYPDFQVVFISRDTSAAEMNSYMAEMKMPWPALRYDAVQWSAALNKYCGPGIPCLVLIDGNGEVLSDSYKGGQYVGPGKVLNDLRDLLTKGGIAVVGNTPAPVPVKAASPSSPTGTNWDQIFKKRSP